MAKKNRNNEKIIATDQWAEKHLREHWTMPFGSICGIIGEAFQGRKISAKELEKLTRKAFDLSMEFTKKAFERIERQEIEKEVEIPIKK